jgi:GNAT superfamily N-acetyltransferase
MNHKFADSGIARDSTGSETALATEGESQFSDYTFLKKVRYFFTDNYMLACKLDWVAVDSRYQSQGVGRLLMGKAIDDFREVIERTGVFGLVLQAIDDRVQSFYSDLGFENYGEKIHRKMILPAIAVLDVAAE